MYVLGFICGVLLLLHRRPASYAAYGFIPSTTTGGKRKKISKYEVNKSIDQEAFRSRYDYSNSTFIGNAFGLKNKDVVSVNPD